MLSSSKSELIVLQGRMPGDTTDSCFTEKDIAPNGDCGFKTLGVTRKELVNTLLPLINDISFRENIYSEVSNSLTLQGELSGYSKKFSKIFNDRLNTHTQLDEYCRTLCALCPETQGMQLEEKLKWLKQNNQASFAEKLVAFQSQLTDYEQKLKEICVDVEFVKKYINKYNNGMWLGYESAILFAKQKKISLYIWQRFNKESNQLILTNSYTDESNLTTIHMLSAMTNTHFNRLIIHPELTKIKKYEHELAAKISELSALKSQLASSQEDLAKKRSLETSKDNAVEPNSKKVKISTQDSLSTEMGTCLHEDYAKMSSAYLSGVKILVSKAEAGDTNYFSCADLPKKMKAFQWACINQNEKAARFLLLNNGAEVQKYLFAFEQKQNLARIVSIVTKQNMSADFHVLLCPSCQTPSVAANTIGFFAVPSITPPVLATVVEQSYNSKMS
jgi:hypothetical protein